MKKMLILLCATSLLQPLFAQQATVTETVETVKTYPFSDPDPVADPLHPPHHGTNDGTASGRSVPAHVPAKSG